MEVLGIAISDRQVVRQGTGTTPALEGVENRFGGYEDIAGVSARSVLRVKNKR